MDLFIKKFHRFFSRYSVKKQLTRVYVFAILFPMLILGVFLLWNTGMLLANYYNDLSESDNLRVKTIFEEITGQVGGISDGLVYDGRLHEILSTNYESGDDFVEAMKGFRHIEDYMNYYEELHSITIYTENPCITDYGGVRQVYKTVEDSDWYTRALQEGTPFLRTVEHTDASGERTTGIELVRSFPNVYGGYNAVLCIDISTEYLKKRLCVNDYETLIVNAAGSPLFCSDPVRYDGNYLEVLEVTRDREAKKKTPVIGVDIQGKTYIAALSTLNLWNEELGIINFSRTAYAGFIRIWLICLVIILAAGLLPYLTIRMYGRFFSNRVNTLRETMHAVSNRDYSITEEITGDDEVSAAFADLKTMIAKIEEQDARMYEAMLNEQKFATEQQIMEYKMLSSQINPHFLYNTLEAIRMKALSSDDREVANAIKLLGKSLRYVLENTGTVSVSLKKELDYIEVYLQIIKFRFKDRADYSIELEDGINPEEHSILPLLLQPIVENSVTHGLENLEGGGHIGIRVYQGDMEHLCIEISDNGCGMDAEQLEELKARMMDPELGAAKSIGLNNIYRRIKLCYGAQYGIDIDSTPDTGTRITVKMPQNFI